MTVDFSDDPAPGSRTDVAHSGSSRARRPPVDVGPYTLEFEQATIPVVWTALFGNDHPVELEIGSGKGLFLANAASANPGHNFLGIELAKKYARRAAERVAKLELRNVRVCAGDARLFMTRYVPDSSLRAVHVYFPDPWWKKRHKKRRVFAEPLVADIERTLVDGGELCVATDVAEYFGVIRELVGTHSRFSEVPIFGEAVKAPEHDLDYLTNFERKYRIEGRPIYRTQYRLSGRAGRP